MDAIDTSVLHVAVVVRDLDTAVRAWTGFLGVEPAVVQIANTSDDEYRGGATTAQCKQAIYDLGGFQIELMEPLGEPSVWAEHLESQGEGLHHIAFRVRGMEDGIRSCEASALPLLQRGEFENGRYAYFDRGRLGAMIELLEFDRGHSDF
jgi:catechol 2,3-dioxygenase-like lactoylglutathione lyase family enzyme